MHDATWFAALDLVGRVAVTVAFGWAAVAKLVDLGGLRATLYLSRTTRPWVPQLTVVLPAVELTLAVLLTVRRSAWPAALASAGLLAAFTAFLAADRRAGEGCNCFGRHSRSSRRAGIVRDLLLLAALVPAMAGGPRGPRWGVSGPVELPFLAGCAVLLAGVLGWGFRRDRERRGGRHRAGAPPVTPPEVRRELPPFDVPALDGSRLRLAGLAGLVFVEPGCGQCETVLPLVADRSDVAVLVVAGQPAAVALAAAYRLAPGRVGVDADGGLADACQVPAVPAACRFTPDGVLVDATGRRTARLAVGADAVRALLTPGAGTQDPPPQRSRSA